VTWEHLPGTMKTSIRYYGHYIVFMQHVSSSRDQSLPATIKANWCVLRAFMCFGECHWRFLGTVSRRWRVLKSGVNVVKRECPLPYYRGHHFHDTPEPRSHWPVVVSTSSGYSRLLLRIKI